MTLLRASEPLSPFVAWSSDDRASVVTPPSTPVDSLLVDLLRDVDRVVDRVLAPRQRAQSAVLGALLLILLSTAAFSLLNAQAFGRMATLRATLLLPANALFALAASLGPIYAASLLVAARLPFARLVGVLVTSAATGSLLLAALAPVPYFAWRSDALWGGPIALSAGFLAAGLGAGWRMHRALFVLAEKIARASSPEHDRPWVLSHDEAFRVGILARISMMIVAFTLALAFWGFDLFASDAFGLGG